MRPWERRVGAGKQFGATWLVQRARPAKPLGQRKTQRVPGEAVSAGQREALVRRGFGHRESGYRRANLGQGAGPTSRLRAKHARERLTDARTRAHDLFGECRPYVPRGCQRQHPILVDEGQVQSLTGSHS